MEPLRKARRGERQRLKSAFLVTIIFFLVEVIGGIWSGSLALLTDAGHMLVDISALGLSLLASLLASREADSKRTYGLHRTEVLAALLNGCFLLAVTLWIFWEAVQRVLAPVAIRPEIMLGIGFLGLWANLFAMHWLSPAKARLSAAPKWGGVSLNFQAAHLHVLSDALGSVGVVLAAALLFFQPHWVILDPILSVGVGVLILKQSFSLLRECTHILLEGTPLNMDIREIERELLAIEDVAAVHDLHVWTVTSGFLSLSAHVVVDTSHSAQRVLSQSKQLLAEQFCISHTTLQIEARSAVENAGCGGCLPSAVRGKGELGPE